MQNIKVIEKIREFIKKEIQIGKIVRLYKINSNLSDYFKRSNIKVKLDNCKEIILKEETKLELGGINKLSFSIIYPIKERNLIKNGNITLIGKEINEISEPSIDFGMLILIGVAKTSENQIDKLRQFNFISNGIEGFMIRTIPRRFWSRISTKAIEKRFSFEFFGNAIMYLYKHKFKNLIESMEIIFINSYPELIEEFKEITRKILESQRMKWREKINKWKENIDCDYYWGCDECPYYETCDKIKEVLEAREKIDN